MWRIGDACCIPSPWRRSEVAHGRIVSFDDQTVCVAVKEEFLPNQKYDELFWVSRDEVWKPEQ